MSKARNVSIDNATKSDHVQGMQKNILSFNSTYSLYSLFECTRHCIPARQELQNEEGSEDLSVDYESFYNHSDV